MPAAGQSAEAAAARRRLEATLAKLNPAGGKTETVPEGAGKKAKAGGKKQRKQG